MNTTKLEKYLKNAKEKYNIKTKDQNQLTKISNDLRKKEKGWVPNTYQPAIYIFQKSDTVDVNEAVEFLKEYLNLNKIETLCKNHNLMLKDVKMINTIPNEIRLVTRVYFKDLKIGDILIVENISDEKRKIDLSFESILESFFDFTCDEIMGDIPFEDVEPKSIVGLKHFLDFMLDMKGLEK